MIVLISTKIRIRSTIITTLSLPSSSSSSFSSYFKIPQNSKNQKPKIPKPTTTMQSPLLPISLSSSPSSSSATAMLLRGEIEEEKQSTALLISSSSSSSSNSLEDEKVMMMMKNKKKDKPPFFSRAFSSYKKSLENGNGNGGDVNQKRRRRGAGGSGDVNENEMSRQGSINQNVGHAAAETYLITNLGLKLLHYFGLGYRWISRFLALGCYAVLLMPGFLQVGYFYYTSRQIKRSIVYGDKPRNRLDLYLPKDSDGPKPVLAFVTGGAWVIGYKAWGTLLGLQLAEKDIIVACIDYRNFPQATISDMVDDASQGISFVCNNITEYGGDPNRVYVMGQSAGAHIASCAVVQQAIKECGERESSSWSVSQIKAYFGLSGGYNLPDLVEHFHRRGLYRSIFLSIMEGDQSLGRFSPEVVVQDPNFKSAVSLLPPFILFHGTADYSIPSDASKTFVDALQRVGAKAELVLYEGKTHTDLFVQDSLRGGTDELVKDIASFVHAGDEVTLAKIAVTPPRRRLVPEFMLKLARKISPF